MNATAFREIGSPQEPENQALTDAARVTRANEGIKGLLEAVRPHTSIECVDSIIFA